jgi:hypothetical protein
MANNDADGFETAGGFAFPSGICADNMDGLNFSGRYPNAGGMSLRDYFAARAICAPWGEALGVDQQGFMNDPDTFAANCYAIADAMLKAREQS